MSHPCRNYCSQWTGEQCKGCMISDEAEEITVGSMVVFAGATFNENVGEVLKITSKSIVGNYPASAILNFPSGYPSFSTELSKLRLATPAEKAAGRRIDDPLISDEMASPCAVSDLSKNNNKIDLVSRKDCQVCIEEEMPELFNSKHCSPRNYNNDSALRVSEIKASVAYSKMALTNFTLSEKNGRLKTNNHALKAALAVAIVAGVVGWML